MLHFEVMNDALFLKDSFGLQSKLTYDFTERDKESL